MKGILKKNELLSSHTSWHIGGPADLYYRPADISDLSEFLSTVPVEEPLMLLGLGSNVLIADEGIRGTVIHTLGMKSTITHEDPEGEPNPLVKTLRIEAGMTCAKVAKFCAKEGLAGGEFFAGIPGTIGGALAMNAGAFGGETWRQVVRVEVINRRGERRMRSLSDYQVGYRSVVGPEEEWFVAGYFQFKVGDPTEASLKVKELLRIRNATQPIGVFSCGSVFKNPVGDYAARLIEASKLKGLKRGDAQISPKHANFILNLGQASANDVKYLIDHIREIVLRDHQIQLHPEVRILGF